jgi:glycosyltransferase involved in cell wall biosynthesis
MTNNPLLSVLIIAYNHEAYIEQTLESVVTQETDFPFEIVIGDDASTDKTRALCAVYAEKYPHLINLLPTPKNLGVVPNYIRTLEACRGKYVAHLDGDDYWTDPKKLQKQVEKLKKDPNLTISYTSRRVFREDWKENGDGLYDITDGENDRKYYARDFANNAFFHLSTIVFRRPTDGKIARQLALFKNIVDRPLSIMLLEEMGGYAVKIPDVCIVFRMNSNSLFTPTDEIKRSAMTNEMYAQLSKLYPHLTKYFNHHLNVSAYFALRDAYRNRDKTTVRQLANQILSRPTFSQNWRLKIKTALHIPLVAWSF